MNQAHGDVVGELHELIESGADGERLDVWLEGLEPGDRVRAVSGLPQEDRDRLLGVLSAERAAELVVLIPEVQAVEVIEHLPAEAGAAIVAELPSDVQADVVQQMGASEAERLLSVLPAEEAEQIRALARYELDVAGGLMVKEYLSYADAATVAEVVHDLRTNADRYRDYHVQYAYVVDDLGKLEGVLQLRELLLRGADEPLREVAIREPLSVRDDAALEELERFFDEHGYFGVPVVDRFNRLIGVVHRSDVEEAMAERSGSDYMKSQGIVGGEELRTMPLGVRSRKRLSWLSVNIVLNLVSASVIAANQDVLDKVIVLAVFLPIISDMSGCSGNQAVAVSMRELSLGVTRPTDLFRVLWKEMSLGVVNGIVLACLIGGVAFVYQQNVWLSLVIAAALSVNITLAVSLGGCLPLIIKGVGKDPALASGPILTTLTDICGFFLVLSLASVVISRLPGGGDEVVEVAARSVEVVRSWLG